MLKIIKGTIALVITLSCTNPDCNDVKKAFYPEEYNLIVVSTNIDPTWIKASGYSHTKNTSDNIMVHNNWIVGSEEIEAGDTIKKEKGQLVLSIHKKDTIINHDWFCKGKAY
ncbi:hypothetical protein ASG31_12410 [Chryseobacterium sp. Leaf404]|uniref:hypothetical protein n=1 Tax=unclassified Chryseobacterium TaxID=2593645 RepID=UPI0006F1C46E|nr:MULTISPECIES: hypothetical protein [unclassified Chryseobacterium]KQT16314.1 hypothetical protein ASG31_12410 [Chryseobacterium sp. Leaf404]